MAHVHSHDHSHDQGHHHHHGPVTLTNVNKAFIIGISLNFLFVIIEAGTGFYIDSLALLSDAGHNLADVSTLAMALIAFRLAKVKANNKYTYGYKKTTILTALTSAVILLVSVGAIVYEAIRRFTHPEPVQGKLIAIVAGIGIVINGFTAFLFMKDKEKDINVKGAYLHLMADALVSLGILIGGIIIVYTGWYWIDPVFRLIVAIVILGGTWSLLKESLRLSLDGVPSNIDLEKIKAAALKVEGVQEIHHIHIWAISTTQNALTAHIVIDPQTTLQELQKIKHEFKHEMLHQNIHHVTLESEIKTDGCKDVDCDAENE